MIKPLVVLAENASPQQLQTVVQKLEQTDGIAGAAAPTDWRKGGTLSLVEAFPDTDSSARRGASDDLARQERDAAGGRDGDSAERATLRLGGAAPEERDFVHAVYGNFPYVLAFVIILTFILLMRAFRSVVLAIKAVVMNLISLGIAFGIVVFIFQQGHGSDAIWGIKATDVVISWIPMMIFAFLFGLSMDYEVFIISRIREEYDRLGDTGEAIATGIARTGKLVTSAALVLVFAFFALSMSPGPDIKQFGIGLAAGILIDATLIRSVLVPSFMKVLGNANWWFPPVVARILFVKQPPPPRRRPVGRRPRARDRLGAGRAPRRSARRRPRHPRRRPRAATSCACAGSARRRSRGPAPPCSRPSSCTGKPSGSSGARHVQPAAVVRPVAAGEDDRADAGEVERLRRVAREERRLLEVGPPHVALVGELPDQLAEVAVAPVAPVGAREQVGLEPRLAAIGLAEAADERRALLEQRPQVEVVAAPAARGEEVRVEPRPGGRQRARPAGRGSPSRSPTRSRRGLRTAAAATARGRTRGSPRDRPRRAPPRSGTRSARCRSRGRRRRAASPGCGSSRRRSAEARSGRLAAPGGRCGRW